MAVRNTFEIIIIELSRSVSPIQTLCENIDEFSNFLLVELGWNVNDIPSQLKQLMIDVRKLVELTQDINNSEPIDNTKIIEVFGTLIRVINTVKQIAESPDNAGLLPSLIAEQFLIKMPDEILQYLIVEFLRTYYSLTFSTLQLLGITSIEQVNEFTESKTPHIKRHIYWSHFIDILINPKEVFRRIYHWGENNFNFLLFAYNLQSFLHAIGFNAYLSQMNDHVATVLEEKDILESHLIKYYFKFPFAITNTNDAEADFGIGLFPLPRNNDLKPGFSIMPYGNAEVSERIQIADKLYFVFETSLTIAGGVGIVIRPEQEIKIFTGFAGGSENASLVNGSFRAGLLFTNTNNTPTRLLAISNDTYLEMQNVSIYFGASLSSTNRKDFFVEFELKGGKLVIGNGGRDGFLSRVLPPNGINAAFEITVGISALQGAYFRGSGGLELQLPTHIQLGPIEIQALTISATPRNESIPVNAGASIKLALGPLTIVVENLGARAAFSFPERGGNLGVLNLDLGFKPPNGVGLSINAGAVIGGGYLFFDFEKEEYAGALELTIAGFIAAKAIGLITTKMPDGSQGFSMLIIITAEFNPPFQLGYGFTLIGVGGLLGLNRTVLLDPLREAVRTGAVNNIMFPQNVIANAPRIISDLKLIFPPCEGKFLIGPMGKLGWGTPTLVSLSFGLIIEIPGNIAILGVLRILLPEPRAPLVQIQVAFVGILNFDSKLLTFDASLYQSSILSMTLEGDMAVRLKWGDMPDFILTVGGFHPSYSPPPLALPTFRRLALNILNTAVARIRVECYMAVTSNTVQFGARAEIFFDLRVCSISGHISFDALFQFSPFYFIIELAADFSLKVLGLDLLSVRVRMSLEGPTPWRARGTGSLSLLFFEVSADFDITWGETQNTSLPDVEILPRLMEELNKMEQWSTVLSTGKNLLVSLRKLEETTPPLLVLHPAGSLVIQQKLLPLTVKIDKVGNQKTSDVQQVTVSGASSDGVPLTISHVEENFARAQYQNLSDEEKLSKPSFEKMPGGVQVSMGAGTIKNGKMVRKKVAYEITIVDKEPVKPLAIGLFYIQPGVLFNHFLSGNSVSKSVLSKSRAEKLQPFKEKLNVREEGYTVAFQANNSAFNSAATFSSELMAQTYLQEQIRRNPALRTDIHVIPNYELQEP